MQGLNDTHPEIERVWIKMLREAGPERRVAMACDLTTHAIALSKAAIARTHPNLPLVERELFFISVVYGDDLARRIRARTRSEAAA